ncbi:MAG: hypothetical protein ACXQTL_00710 [Methanosarcinales archaeon]
MTLILYDKRTDIEIVLRYPHRLARLSEPGLAPGKSAPITLSVKARVASKIDLLKKQMKLMTRSGEKLLLVDDNTGVASMGYLKDLTGDPSTRTRTPRTEYVLPVDGIFICDSGVLGVVRGAEECTLSGGAVVVSDDGACGGRAVALGERDANIYFSVEEDLLLPESNYTVWVRAKDTDHVVDDLTIGVYDERRVASLVSTTESLTGEYAWYDLDLFVSEREFILPCIRKNTQARNTISVDLIALVPL